MYDQSMIDSFFKCTSGATRNTKNNTNDTFWIAPSVSFGK